jgi:hypothetical protein
MLDLEWLKAIFQTMVSWDANDGTTHEVDLPLTTSLKPTYINFIDSARNKNIPADAVYQHIGKKLSDIIIINDGAAYARVDTNVPKDASFGSVYLKDGQFILVTTRSHKLWSIIAYAVINTVSSATTGTVRLVYLT